MRRNAVDAASVTLPGFPRLLDVFSGFADMAQPQRHIRMKAASGLGQVDSAVGALKQHRTQLGFKRADGVAHRGLRHAQFLCRPGEAHMPACGFEDDQSCRPRAAGGGDFP
jgi:hypothetical protein